MAEGELHNKPGVKALYIMKHYSQFCIPHMQIKIQPVEVDTVQVHVLSHQSRGTLEPNHEVPWSSSFAHHTQVKIQPVEVDTVQAHVWNQTSRRKTSQSKPGDTKLRSGNQSGHYPRQKDQKLPHQNHA